MQIYMVSVFGCVIVTSLIILLIVYVLKILNNRMVLAISLSSAIIGLLIPGIFNMLSTYQNTAGGISQSQIVPFAVGIYILIAFILSLIISMAVPGKAFTKMASTAGNSQVDNTLEGMIQDADEPVINIENGTDANYLEEIYNSRVSENTIIMTGVNDEIPVLENYLEKSVDSVKNIDKMGLEVLAQDILGNLSVEDCIEEAFRLKMLGDLEGAILHFMYALDRKPGKELVFLIVLDICVLYKSLGQIELAKDILSSYIGSFKDLMDAGIRAEIENNLANIEE